MMKVPFVDLRAQHEPIENELKAVFERVLKNSSFIMGPEIKQFETEFANYLGVAECATLNSGTSAIQVVLQALGVGPGHEVITVANTFIATAEAISATGAVPVFVDVDPVSYTMDPAKVEKAITPQTKAILPVHLYGQSVDLDPLLAIAKKHNIALVEDACQAHGATYKGRKVGGIGTAGCFSFYPSKNLGACGEGGAVVSNDAELMKKVKMLRDHGSTKRYYHDFPAYNFRLEGLQGGILSVKLKHLDAGNEGRRAVAAKYNELLAGSGVVTPTEMPYAKHIYHLYIIQVDDRDALGQALTAKTIEWGLHYPLPLHLQEAYKGLGYKQGDFPVSERLVKRIISLPMFPELSMDKVAYVAEAVREFAGRPAAVTAKA